ncbi:hypothetical protein ACWDG1_49170 [Streptomyces sp. NPDC001177]
MPEPVLATPERASCGSVSLLGALVSDGRGAHEGLGYGDVFGPWKTTTAEKLIDTGAIRHPQYGLISCTYR